jgi:hypothetical protein
MSKQEKALKHWEDQMRLKGIQELLARANNPMDTVGQVHANIQLARVSVPWLLEYVERLKESGVSTSLEARTA